MRTAITHRDQEFDNYTLEKAWTVFQDSIKQLSAQGSLRVIISCLHSFYGVALEGGRC